MKKLESLKLKTILEHILQEVSNTALVKVDAKIFKHFAVNPQLLAALSATKTGRQFSGSHRIPGTKKVEYHEYYECKIPENVKYIPTQPNDLEAGQLYAYREGDKFLYRRGYLPDADETNIFKI